MIERVTVIKFRMDDGGGNGAGCFEVEIWADSAKFTNVIVAGFRKCRDLAREGKVFIKDKAKVASRVGFSERREFLGGRFRQLAMSPIFVDIVEVQINAPRIFGGQPFRFNINYL